MGDEHSVANPRRSQEATTETAQTVVFPDVFAQFATMETPGQRLHKARVARGLGIRELGRLAKVDPTAISRIESGKRGARGTTEIGTFVKLCAPLRARLAWVLTGEGPMDEVPQVSRVHDPYPERQRALERLAGLLAPDVEASVRGTIPGTERHPTELAWIAHALRIQREHEEGFAVTSEDPRPPRTGEISRVPTRHRQKSGT
jgi:transcriptional regulator with XRE-family HTH domain